jgi:hypothetical protein
MVVAVGLDVSATGFSRLVAWPKTGACVDETPALELDQGSYIPSLVAVHATCSCSLDLCLPSACQKACAAFVPTRTRTAPWKHYCLSPSTTRLPRTSPRSARACARLKVCWLRSASLHHVLSKSAVHRLLVCLVTRSFRPDN